MLSKCKHSDLIDAKSRSVISHHNEIQTPASRQLLSSKPLEKEIKRSTLFRNVVENVIHKGHSSANDANLAISTDHHSRHKFSKHKPKRYWNTRRQTIPQDPSSESESAPLLSSASHASAEPMMFNNSETSELDSDFSRSCTRYGSVTTASFDSAATMVLPERFSPHKINNLPNAVNNTEDLMCNRKCYDIPDINMISLPIKGEPTLTPFLDALPKQSSLVTIFSIWNTILGSSLLTMPWGILMAGVLPGVALILIMSGLCLYTAHRLLQAHKYHGGQERTEVPELCRVFLGPFAEFSAKLFSITVLLGANIAYWILMSNCLYNSVNFIHDKLGGYDMYPHTQNDSQLPEVLCPKESNFNSSGVLPEKTFDNLGTMWDLHKTVPFFLGLIMFPLLNFNSTTFFTKFNSLGTAAIGYLMFIVIAKASNWGINMDKFSWEMSWQLKSTFPALCGMLALSFFIHNIIITIMQHNRNQNNNGRDLTVAYVLVTLTYVVVGLTFYISFPLAKTCIEDNFLNNFQKWDVLGVGARIVLFFQLLTVYPLITYMLRIRVLNSIFHSHNPPRVFVVLVNLIVIGICMIFARFLPYVGTVIRYTGAISGLVYVFTLPSLLHLVILYRKGKARVQSVIFHLVIPIIGVANLIAQLFVSSH